MLTPRGRWMFATCLSLRLVRGSLVASLVAFRCVRFVRAAPPGAAVIAFGRSVGWLPILAATVRGHNGPPTRGNRCSSQRNGLRLAMVWPVKATRSGIRAIAAFTAVGALVCLYHQR